MKTISTTMIYFALAAHASAWDPIGDITNPGRILDNVVNTVDDAVNDTVTTVDGLVRDIPNAPANVVRELEVVGRRIDEIRLEINAQAGADTFAAWLQRSRDDASSGASSIPDNIRAQLTGFFPPDILDRVQYKVGDPGALNLAALSIDYGDAAAVTLIDVVVFANESGVGDAELWAHELRHVQQFEQWGVRDFAIRYLRSWNGVETDAYGTQNAYRQWKGQPLLTEVAQANPITIIEIPPPQPVQPGIQPPVVVSPGPPSMPPIQQQGNADQIVRALFQSIQAGTAPTVQLSGEMQNIYFQQLPAAQMMLQARGPLSGVQAQPTTNGPAGTMYQFVAQFAYGMSYGQIAINNGVVVGFYFQ